MADLKPAENGNTTKEIDPAQDLVYQRTTNVVKSIIELNTGVQIARPEEFIDLVKVSQYDVFSH